MSRSVGWTRSIVLILISISTACLAGCHTVPVPELPEGEPISQEELRILYAGTVEPLSEEERALYDGTVGCLLKEDLWTERDLYDACHYLMIPMHYAFYAGDELYITSFAAFFQRFTDDVTSSDIHQFVKAVDLNKRHFFYFCTQFMALCAANGYDSLIPAGLPAMVEEYARYALFDCPASWNTEDTMIEHIRQIIAGKQYDTNYKGVFIGEERFLLALLCDLNYFHTLRGEEYSNIMDDAADLAYQAFKSPHLIQETEKDGWLIQPGGWSDYPDYAYAGNEFITENIQPKPREDIAEDSSHSMTLPLLLRSWQSAQPNQTRWDLFSLRREQLANQMVNYVLKNVDGKWLCTTFMDGTNGVYRYAYHEDGVGLAGWDLSEGVLLGWWSMLADSRITACYQDILNDFPMKGDRSNPYFDHATVREQNPFFDTSTAFDTGMYECIVACAAKIKL